MPIDSFHVGCRSPQWKIRLVWCWGFQTHWSLLSAPKLCQPTSHHCTICAVGHSWRWTWSIFITHSDGLCVSRSSTCSHYTTAITIMPKWPTTCNSQWHSLLWLDVCRCRIIFWHCYSQCQYTIHGCLPCLLAAFQIPLHCQPGIGQINLF